ncbi:glycosyltransferase [Microbacterium mcarthurae (nom. nud.)]|uniref:Glycosyltransferase n=1 Tax=Microbacterium mcarthurae TaxID=3035918 RepID=A0ABW9GI37_9MICO
MSSTTTITSFATVNHTVFPVRGVAEVSSLYVDTGDGSDSQPGESYEIQGRRSIRIFPHRRVSMGTFFNAFPASYWQRFTNVRAVRLSATLSGRGLLSVYKSSARGRSSAVASRSFSDETVEIDLPLTSFIDGGYYWFDVACAGGEATLEGAEWQVPDTREVEGTVTVGITTFNRPTYALDQLVAVGEDEGIKDVLDTILLVDQGTDLVSNQPGFPAAAEVLGDRLRVIRQANLGGSGGFGRAMLETLRGERSRYVLLLDDDAISEPEAIVRSVRFADFCIKPTIVGGGMLHLDERAVLYTQGETWDYGRSWMRPSGESEYDHDFAEDTLRATPELHRRLAADFNGWWMCLIPTEVLDRIGLSLPVFLKFDDIEFSLRAGDQGYPTVCLPGVAVWHMAWHDKDPSRTWEEYFIHRNRWITGLLHPGGKRGAALPLMSFLGDIKLLFMLQYSTVRLRHEALADLLRGPSALPGLLPQRQAEIRQMRGQYSDARVVENLADLPVVRRAPGARGTVRRPTNPVAALVLAARVAVRQLLVRETAHSKRHPERIIPAPDISWWRFSDIDSALVTSPDGLGVAWYQRDRALMRRFLIKSVMVHLKLWRRFPRLSAQYRDGLTDITSPAAWEKIFTDTSAS